MRLLGAVKMNHHHRYHRITHIQQHPQDKARRDDGVRCDQIHMLCLGIMSAKLHTFVAVVILANKFKQHIRRIMHEIMFSRSAAMFTLLER